MTDPQIIPAPAGYTANPTRHLWMDLPLIAVEGNGDGEITGVLPETGERLTVSTSAGDENNPGEELNTYDQLRRLIDAMEKVDFFG
jgi:hypothetical protein